MFVTIILYGWPSWGCRFSYFFQRFSEDLLFHVTLKLTANGSAFSDRISTLRLKKRSVIHKGKILLTWESNGVSIISNNLLVFLPCVFFLLNDGFLWINWLVPMGTLQMYISFKKIVLQDRCLMENTPTITTNEPLSLLASYKRAYWRIGGCACVFLITPSSLSP